MKKITLCFMLTALLIFGAVSAVAVSAADTGFELEITASTKEVKPGESFNIDIFVINIKEANGIVSTDFPLRFDADKLELVSKEEVYPAIWKGNGDNFGPDEPASDGLFWQRLLFDGDGDDYDSSGVKGSRELGVKFVFKAKAGASGAAVIKVEENISLRETVTASVLKDNDVKVINGKGGSVTINISDGSAASSSAAEESSAVPQSSAEESSVASSSEELSEESEAGVSEASAESGEEVSGSSEASDVSAAESSEGFEPTDDATSADESGALPVGDESADASAGGDSASEGADSAASTQSGAEGSQDGEEGDNLVVKVLIIVGIAGVGIALIVFAWIKLSSVMAGRKPDGGDGDDDGDDTDGDEGGELPDDVELK